MTYEQTLSPLPNSNHLPISDRDSLEIEIARGPIPSPSSDLSYLRGKGLFGNRLTLGLSHLSQARISEFGNSNPLPEDDLGSLMQNELCPLLPQEFGRI